MRNPAEMGFPPVEHTTFSLNHKHSGIHGDGQKVKAASLDTVDPFAAELEPSYIPVNAATSGRKYRIQIIEVLDENNALQPVIQIVPVS
jgi:hypothetical protein